MYLTTAALQERLEQTKTEIIEGAVADKYGKFNYDLRIKNIIVVGDEEGENNKVLQSYVLPSGDTVFVSSEEIINIPLDLVGIVTSRNSSIRTGLQIDSPVYHPGHKTRVFLRVTNISKNDIKLESEQSIASIMFAQLSDAVEKYEGRYVAEFDYKGVGDFTNDLPKTVKISKKMESIENIEKRIYEKVITLLTIFVGIFSLINLNVHFLNEAASLSKMLIYNLISIGGIGLMVGFVGFIIHKNTTANWIVAIISLLLIISTFFLV